MCRQFLKTFRISFLAFFTLVSIMTSGVMAAVVLDKSASTTVAAIGDVITFTITASNLDANPLADIDILDTFPVGMTYVSHVVTDGTVSISGQDLVWHLSSLAVSDSSQLTVAVSLGQQGSLTNTVSSLGATSASATVMVLASAVTHFRMDEPVDSWSGAAGEVIDSGGTSLHGRRLTSSSPTTTNIVDPSPSIAVQHPSVIGSFCNAAMYDGNAIVEVADSPLLDYTTQLSASVWIYPTAYPSSGLYSILSNDVNYEFHINSSGHLFWWWQASTLTSAATIPLNQWTHVAITLDSSSAVRRQRIYINGVQDSNVRHWHGTLRTNNCNFHIGGDVSTSNCQIMSARNFHGMIDEVKLYRFELSQEEVVADMRLGRSCSGTFDHIRIEHDGVASICAPERITIKACMDADCTALYPGDVTVNLSPTGWVGGGTFSFRGGIGVRSLARSTPEEVTLGTTSVSPNPGYSSRCFNGSDETCTLEFETASCTFDAVEVGGDPQTPIFTKLSGVSFDLDVLALLDPTTINTGYTGSVSVDLVDSTGATCPTGAGLTAATDITYTSGDAGRKTVSFSYSHAARNVRVRATVAGVAPACSTDNFSVRPQTLDVSSPDATNTSLGGTPIVVAGAPFTLLAAALPGYDGIPEIDNSLIVGSPIAGYLSGVFNSADPVTGISSGMNISYDEVGHFGLNQNAIYDDSFTGVDQPGDCAAGFSNTLSGGRYGCSFGNQLIPLVVDGSGFGRFVPARLAVSSNTPVFANSCSSSFTYMGQEFDYLIDPELTVTALNQAGTVTSNYGDNYWRLLSNLSGRSYTSNVVTTANLTLSTSGSAIWNGTTDSDGVGTVTLSGEGLTHTKPAVPASPFTTNIDLTFSAADLTDSDGVCFDPENDGTCNSYSINPIVGGEQRYGRMLLSSAFGPETLPLVVPVMTEYYAGSSFVLNTLDNCSSYNSTDLILDNFQGNLASGETLASGSGTLLSGIGNSLSLSAPGVGNDGSVDVTLDLSLATGAGLEWLQSSGNNPKAKATFGIFKGNNHLIYMRESVW